jgi:hypothetical protein
MVGANRRVDGLIEGEVKPINGEEVWAFSRRYIRWTGQYVPRVEGEIT